jgi:spermidine synthase
VFEDGRKFVENNDTRYDVVIVDVVDMLDNGPAQALYTRQFYHSIKSRLRDNGILAVQALELDPLTYEPHATLGRTVRTAFPEVHSYRAHIPSFLGSWGFLIASDWLSPQDWSAERVDEAIQQRLGHRWLQHLSGRFLMACFGLCQKTERLLQLPGPIIEDGAEFVLPPEIVETTREFGSFPALPGQPT